MNNTTNSIELAFVLIMAIGIFGVWYANRMISNYYHEKKALEDALRRENALTFLSTINLGKNSPYLKRIPNNIKSNDYIKMATVRIIENNKRRGTVVSVTNNVKHLPPRTDS